MQTRLSALKTKSFNKLIFSTITLDSSFSHKLKGNYFIRQHSTSTVYQPRILAPVYAEELTDQSIEEMTAALSPLESATIEIFNAGNISHGSIGLEAHTTITEAFNRIALKKHGVKSVKELRKLPNYRGPMSGSGEGGQLAFRNNTLWDSMMKQIASGRFGVTSEYLASCHEIQIKIAQGAKPGVGGELPGEKVSLEIALARLTEPGVTLVSPSLNHDVSSIEDLKQLIYDLRSANPNALISVKLVMTENIGVIAVGTAKCGADVISIAGPGGTGAASLTAKHEFTPTWEAGLAEAHQALITEGLRSSVRLVVSGGIQTGEECFKALLLGADGIELGTELLVAMGCVNAKRCHDSKNPCPVGIATTNQKVIDDNFKGKPEHVARILVELAKSVAALIEYYGYSHPSQVVGQTQLLAVKSGAPVTGLEDLLHQPVNPWSSAKLEKSTGSSYLEQTLIWKIAKGQSTFHAHISNADLSFGARMAYHLYDEEHFKNTYYQQPVTIIFNGEPGQSFGFVAPPNLTLIVDNANDGTGKSLDGATIYVKNAAGNQTGYGATRGEIMTRFTGDHAFVRNSGAHLVCEVMGEMGANFMTGGSVTILGTPDCFPHINFDGSHFDEPYQPPVQFRKDIIGPNFGASFTGGVVFLPARLYSSMYHHNYLASPAAEMSPQELSDAELDMLVARIKKYAKEISNPFIAALQKLDKRSLKSYFIKLNPKALNKTPSPRNPAIKLLTIPQTLPTITPSSKESPVTLSEKKINAAPTVPESRIKGMFKFDRELDACGTGVLAHRKGKATHHLVQSTLAMLAGFMHRGATGIDPMTGDGCGMTLFGTHYFYRVQFPNLNLQKGKYGIIHLALPKEAGHALEQLTALIEGEALTIKAKRNVPVNSSVLGHIAQQKEPEFLQLLIAKPDHISREEFEKQLIRIHMQFELLMQKDRHISRPHILSASSYHVTYKALAKEDKLGAYFPDLQNVHLAATAGVAHARFSTNTLPAFENIQPFKFANNGENNALHLLIDLLEKHPLFKEILGINYIVLSGLSDSHIMSIYMNMLHLLGYSAEEIVASTIQKYEPEPKVRSSDFYNLFGVPFEGPNASILMMNDKIIVVGDKNRFRPQRGIMNEDYLYVGSEYGPVQLTGDRIDLPPATPLIIDLENNTTGIYQPHEAVLAFHHQQMSQLKSLQPDYHAPEPIRFGENDLQLRKTRAGWTDELNKYFMQPLYEGGKGLLSSMGNQGPVEAFVRGAYNDIYAYFYGKFSQVTNPPLAIKEEKAYMSAKVFVGQKPLLQDLGVKFAEGYELSSPIVNNYEMEDLKKSKLFNTHIVDTIFPAHEKPEDMEAYIETLAEDCVKQVKNGVNFLILSDIRSDDFHVALPPVITAALVHDALLKAGLRRNVTLALQAGSVLTGREVAQAASIGGVDIINPYLAFIPSIKTDDIHAFRKRCAMYQAALTQELLGFMARMGISTVSAYRGTKGFYSYGVNADLAKKLGIGSILSGTGLKEMARAIITWHQRPKQEGLGRYDLQQDNRKGIWAPEHTKATIDAARGNGSWAEAEKGMNAAKSGFARGWLQLKPSQVWNKKNPMPVLILGGGAAGLNVTKELLASGLPLTITIIELNVVNPMGLLGNGVAPDHPGTKNHGKLLRDVFNDERVTYYGGVEVGKDVTIKELQSRYACIIDCCGASKNRMLNVEGESLSGVLSADELYKAYNNAFNPMLNPEKDWRFFPPSKNDEMAIIGSGNVAADVARILLNQDLEETNINPEFLEALQKNAPAIIRLIAIETPDKTRISLNQLENLAAKKVWMTAHFDCAIDESKLNETEKKLYQFFLKIKNNTPPLENGQQIHFHFNWAAKSFRQNGDEIEAVFTDPDKRELVVRAKTFIKAIGVVPDDKHDHSNNERKGMYQCGWRTGQGGTLKSAKMSAEQVVENIKRDFHRGELHHLGLVNKTQDWQIKSSVGNHEQLNILAWLDEGKLINTPEDFIKARRSAVIQETVIQALPIVPETPPEKKPDMQAGDPNAVTLLNSKTGEKRVFQAGSMTLYQAMKESEKYPHCACGGDGICGDCKTEIIVQPAQLKQPSKKEADLLKLYKRNADQTIFACMKPLNDLVGGVYEDPAVAEVNKNLRS